MGNAFRSISGGKFAILVDCDNMPSSKIHVVFDTISSLGGVPIHRRLYGNDFASRRLKRWDKAAAKWLFTKVEAKRYVKGKNLIDFVLTIDAMKLLSHQDVDCFVIVSSDSDFTPLVLHLRESGKYVIGFGMHQTPLPFIKAYNSFIYLDGVSVCARKETSCEHSDTHASTLLARGDVTLTQSSATNQVLGGRGLTNPLFSAPLDAEEKGSMHGDPMIFLNLKNIIASEASENGWVHVSSVGKLLKSSDKEDALVKNMSLTSILKSSDDHFELNLEADNCTYKVRLKPSSKKLECDQKPSELTNKKGKNILNSLTKKKEKKEVPILPEIKRIVVELGGETSWVRLDQIGSVLRNRHDTHVSTHGYKTLSHLIASHDFSFEVIAKRDGKHHSWYVRMKDKSPEKDGSLG